jgi:Ca2+-binding EF-hand superfamily protein
LSQINEKVGICADDVGTHSRSSTMKSPDQAAFKFILIVSVIVALAMLPFVARAECQQQGHGPPPFSKFDQDGDGLVSEEEFNSARAAHIAERAAAGGKMKGLATAPAFADLDTDGDGMLNEAELTAGQKAHMKAMHEQRGGHGMHGGNRMPTFGDLDLNDDGCIDPEEFATHQAERHGKQ